MAETPIKKRVEKIISILKEEFPDAECSLHFKNPFELLMATIMASQCTDARVNLVTPQLFAKYKGPKEMAKADPQELQKIIHSVGFYKNKSQAMIMTSQLLLDRYQGQVPQSMENLLQLRGVGRKTANVILGVAYQIPGIVVDTHVKRLSQRIGLTKYSQPDKIEIDLTKIVPREEWTLFSHLLVFLGRKICLARNPQCESCPISLYCPKFL